MFLLRIQYKSQSNCFATDIRVAMLLRMVGFDFPVKSAGEHLFCHFLQVG